MISAAWDWYYGSQDEELLADCVFSEPYSTKRSSIPDICIRPATLADGLQVTVFTQVKSRPKEKTSLEKCSTRLKLLRHPNVLRHVGIVATETEVHLVTERVSPLTLQFETVDANEVSSGMYDIAQALKFIHEKAKLTHNWICLDSIYVTEGGAWKLGNFENACEFSEATAPFLKGLTRLKEIIPPEESDNMVAFPIETKHAHCRDVYALGVLLGLFYEQTRFASGIQSQELKDLLEEILQSNYKQRPTVSELLDTSAWSSEYIEIVNFLQSITLKSLSEKKIFFNGLLLKLKNACISDELIAKRIAKLLLSPVVLSEDYAVDKVIPRLLTPVPMRPQTRSKGLISSSMFARYVIPQIVDLLGIKILHVRLVLVSNFHRYVHMFEKTVLQDCVLPEVLLGLHDSNNQLVSASLHALADSVPVVGGDLIVGSEREKIFGFGMPKFDGSVLVDTSSLAYEMKPKRKPKKPPKKPSPKKPITLLELAMRKKGKGNNVSPSRDLMLLKQQELASTLHTAQPNGDINYITVEEDHETAINPSTKPDTSAEDDVVEAPAKQPSPVPVPVHPPFEPTIVKPVQTGSNKNSTSSVPVQTSPRKTSVPVQQPEVETWASSDSDGDWGAFETLEQKSPEKIHSEQIQNGQGSPTKAKILSKDRSSNKKNPKPHKTLSSEKQTILNQPRQQKIQNLGSEFEISVKVTPKPVEAVNLEPDFFADMAPEIQTRSTLIIPPSQTVSRVTNNGSIANSTKPSRSSLSSPNSMSLATGDSADDEGSEGWEDNTISWDVE